MELPLSCKKILLFMIWAGTYVKVLAKMQLIYWTCSVNHHIPNWGMTFLTTQLATTWTLLILKKTKQKSKQNSLPMGQP